MKKKLLDFKRFVAHIIRKEPIVLETYFGNKERNTPRTDKEIRDQEKDRLYEDTMNMPGAKAYKAIEKREHAHYDLSWHTRVIHDFTTHSGTVNKHLVNHATGQKDAISPHSHNFIKKMDHMFDRTKAKMKADTHVYTGVHPDVLRHAAYTKDDHMVAHLPAYTSTSTSKDVAEGFAGDHTDHDNHMAHILHIHVKEGHPAIPVDKHSANQGEHEVVLHRGTLLKIHPVPVVEKLKHGGKIATWHAETIGHNPHHIKHD
jgi:hypothetical protein